MPRAVRGAPAARDGGDAERASRGGLPSRGDTSGPGASSRDHERPNEGHERGGSATPPAAPGASDVPPDVERVTRAWLAMWRVLAPDAPAKDLRKHAAPVVAALAAGYSPVQCAIALWNSSEGRNWRDSAPLRKPRTILDLRDRMPNLDSEGVKGGPDAFLGWVRSRGLTELLKKRLGASSKESKSTKPPPRGISEHADSIANVLKGLDGGRGMLNGAPPASKKEKPS